MLRPQKGNPSPSLNKRRKIQKLYTTNCGDFAFRRSKTDDVDLNRLCGWENDDEGNKVGLHQQFSDSFYI